MPVRLDLFMDFLLHAQLQCLKPAFLHVIWFEGVLYVQ